MTPPCAPLERVDARRSQRRRGALRQSLKRQSEALIGTCTPLSGLLYQILTARKQHCGAGDSAHCVCFSWNATRAAGHSLPVCLPVIMADEGRGMSVSEDNGKIRELDFVGVEEAEARAILEHHEG